MNGGEEISKPVSLTRIDLSTAEVELWLDSHPDFASDYFLRKTQLPVINSWLVAHGFLTINDYVSYSRRNSGSSGNTSPGPGHNHEDVPITPHNISSASAGSHKRTNSKKCLRHDFARAKNRNVFRTHEQTGHETNISTSRRNSLKDMRKYTSLPPNSANMLSLLIESKVRLPQTFPLHNRTTKQALFQTQDENEFFLSIVRDIATELDLKSLSQKTIDNLSVLLGADGASLFLVEGGRGGRQSLVSKIFDVHCGASTFLLPGTQQDNEIQVPWGVGVLGHVADTGETVNLQVACEDPRFDDEVDKIIGYHTESLLCMPVRNAYDEVIAVAQVVNKNPENDSGCFTLRDQQVFETYLQFVGIAITNAQLMETSRQEYDRNRNLLEIVHDLFEEQTSLEKVILKIMQRGQRLVKCQRAAVLLLDDTLEQTSFAKLFELSNANVNGQTKTAAASTKDQMEKANRYMLGLAEKVATSGELINIADSLEVEKGCGGDIKTLLAMPIRNSRNQIIGVATIINKLNGQPFDENDEHLFEAFTIFCGLGIHNTIMYSEVERAMAKQKVAFEVLSYHATAGVREVEAIMDVPVPCADEWNLFSLNFNDFSLDTDEMIRGAVAMFLQMGLVKRFSIEKEILYRFLITVKRNYRDVPYHNWRHAFNVSQIMFAVLMGCEMKSTFSDLEVLGMFAACLCHDLDHRGTNNSFQEKTDSALARLYGTTHTMEHHHFNHAVMILSSEQHNIFSGLSPENYSKVIKVLKQCILATDLSVYFQLRPKFVELIEKGSYSWSQEDHRDLLKSMLMTASDLAASCKPWPIQQQVAQLVTQEFLVQGDKERRELHITPQPLMDRERQGELPQMQLDWIQNICLPLYDALALMNPKLGPLRDGALANRDQWQLLVHQT